ncbi:MAG: ABC transporter substrate-binding protein [Streptosporangiales bacterium]|nr:ABC transporter substrate-binding protein [Streptosporangiales bacterium]
MEQSPVSSVSQNYNPFNQTSSAGNTLGFTQMIYEPLMQFNFLKPGSKPYPWLATDLKWSNGGKTITFTLRKGVKFSNGEKFDASTAAWEFNQIKKYKDINTYGLPISSASAPNATTLVVNFTSPQYTNEYAVAGQVDMVPQKAWSKVGDPGQYADPKPAGTGPYTLKQFSSQGVTLTANPGYWGGKPSIPNLDFPTYSSNTPANQALEDGSLTWAGNYVQNIQTQFLDKSPNNHCWDVGTGTEDLYPNLTTYPFAGKDGLAVRQAISYGVNRQQISQVGEGGQQPPVQGPGSLTGLTLPKDKQYVTSATAGLQAKTDTAKAKQILQADGWKMGSDGYYAKNGKTLEFTVEDPSEYSDFIVDDNILAAQLKKVGIKVDVKGTTVPGWNADLADGNFNAMMHWTNGGTTPYTMYDNWLDTSLDTGASAKAATGDFERFSGPEADKGTALLKAYAGVAPTDTAGQTKYVSQLGELMAKDLPVIPLFYGVAWGDYSDANFTGWPSPSNPYEPIQPNGPFNEYTVLHLKPKS